MNSPTPAAPVPPTIIATVTSPKVPIEVELRETVIPAVVEEPDRKPNVKEGVSER